MAASPQTVARPYASAVFDLAAPNQAWAVWKGWLSSLAGVLSDASTLSMLANPKLTGEQRVALFEPTLPESIQASARGFLMLLANKKRLGLIPAIAERFDQLVSKQSRVLQVVVDSAMPMDKETQGLLVNVITQLTHQKIEMEVRIDPSLLCGVRIRIGDRVLDDSLRGKLELLRATL